MTTVTSLLYVILSVLLFVNTITATMETWDYHDRTCGTSECFKDITVAYGDCKLSFDKNLCNGINCKFIGNSNIRICVNPTELSEQSDDEIISRIKESAVSIGSQQLCLYDEQGNVYDMLCKRFGGKRCDPHSKKCAMDYQEYQEADAILEPLRKNELKDKLAYDYTDNLLIVIDGTSTKEQFEENEYDAIKGGEYLMSNKARWHNGNWANHASNFYEDYQGAKYYWYGPDNSAKAVSAAQEIRDLVEGTTNTICEFMANHTNNNMVNIDFIGYSRGGYAVMESARKIDRDGCPVNSELINIRFMGLYDPVSSVFEITTNGIKAEMVDGIGEDGLYCNDRYNYVADQMPTNIEHVAVSYGNPKLGSRAYFNTLQDRKDNEKRGIDFKYFTTTHSGIGGGPLEGDYEEVLNIIQGNGWKGLWGAVNWVYGLVLDDVEHIEGYGAKMECTESMNADLHIRSAANKYGVPITATKETYYDFERCPKA